MSEVVFKFQSESLGKLADALAKAQGQIRGAIKDSENPFFKSSYADLAAVWDACREPLSKNGLSIIQTTDMQNNEVLLVTTLVHSSGEFIRGVYPIRPVKPDPQSMGSAVTYARRYALQAMVGIAPEDDDGNAAAGNRAKLKLPPKVYPDQPGPNDGHRPPIKPVKPANGQAAVAKVSKPSPIPPPNDDDFPGFMR